PTVLDQRRGSAFRPPPSSRTPTAISNLNPFPSTHSGDQIINANHNPCSTWPRPTILHPVALHRCPNRASPAISPPAATKRDSRSQERARAAQSSVTSKAKENS